MVEVVLFITNDGKNLQNDNNFWGLIFQTKK